MVIVNIKTRVETNQVCITPFPFSPTTPAPPSLLHHHRRFYFHAVSASDAIFKLPRGLPFLIALSTVCCLQRTLLHCKHPATSFCLHLIIETATLSRLTLHQNWWEEQPLHTMDRFFCKNVCLQYNIDFAPI